jgi:hypothetical protein
MSYSFLSAMYNVLISLMSSRSHIVPSLKPSDDTSTGPATLNHHSWLTRGYMLGYSHLIWNAILQMMQSSCTVNWCLHLVASIWFLNLDDLSSSGKYILVGESCNNILLFVRVLHLIFELSSFEWLYSFSFDISWLLIALLHSCYS